MFNIESKEKMPSLSQVSQKEEKQIFVGTGIPEKGYKRIIGADWVIYELNLQGKLICTL